MNQCLWKKKTSQSLTNVSGSKMAIKYKLNNVYICNKGICLETTFLCIRNLQQELILGTPFLAMLMPMQTSTAGITAHVDGHEIFFEYVSPPVYKKINDIMRKISNKDRQINFLQKEIRIMGIEETLQSPKLKEKISQIQENFNKEICSDIPNAFWDRKKYIVSLPYEKDFNERKNSYKS